MKHVYLLALLFLSGGAIAAAPVVTLTANPTSGNAPLAVTLTWSSTGAVSCTAGGGWTGSKALSGTQAITVSANTSFTLACAAADGTITITWTPPTQNTDDSPLTDLAGYRIFRGATQAAATSSTTAIATINDPAARSYTDTALAGGPYSYTAVAFNSKDLASDKSNATSVVTAVGSIGAATALVVINTKPKPPTGVTATIAVVEGMNMTPVFRFADTKRTVIGYIATNVQCFGPVEFRYRGDAYREVPINQVKFWNVKSAARVVAACGAVGG